MRLILVIWALNCFSVLAVAQDAHHAAAVTKTIDRGLAFLVKDALAWKAEHNCASCHHASLVVCAMREAKRQGHAVNEPVLSELTKWMAESGNGKFGMARPETAPNAASPKAIFFALGVGSDPQPDAVLQSGLTQLLSTVKSEQTADGSWVTWPATRPPIFGRSDESLSLMATLALLPMAAKGEVEAIAARDKAVKWFAESKSDDDPQSIALRVVLWTRLGRPSEEYAPLVQKIKQRQREDGGWAQTAELASDGWATGQALFALAHAGVKANRESIVGGQRFLITTQREDGSWAMTSRPITAGGAGSTSLIPITGGGSAWAVWGLARSEETSAINRSTGE